MRLVIDQDDVLSLTNKRWLDLYNRDWNDTKTLADIHGWNWHMWVRPECGHKIYDYLNLPGFFADMEPLPGAVEGMKYLTEKGHDIMIATATPRISETGYQEKLAWVKKHLPFHNVKGFASIHQKDWLNGDVMLDDGSHNLEDFSGISVAMDRPWNRGEDCCEHRVNNWPEFIKFIDSLDEDNKFRGRMMAQAWTRWTNIRQNRKEREWRHEQG